MRVLSSLVTEILRKTQLILLKNLAFIEAIINLIKWVIIISGCLKVGGIEWSEIGLLKEKIVSFNRTLKRIQARKTKFSPNSHTVMEFLQFSQWIWRYSCQSPRNISKYWGRSPDLNCVALVPYSFNRFFYVLGIPSDVRPINSLVTYLIQELLLFYSIENSVVSVMYTNLQPQRHSKFTSVKLAGQRDKNLSMQR